mmetsp:Transcript_1610/g.3469  ORF Transcript_1610/g.3469 Transcript_1610/m.3469 type:complete len:637 (+) Transcript_1610:126-2036(+)
MIAELHPKRKTASCAFALVLVMLSCAFFASGESLPGVTIETVRKNSSKAIQYSAQKNELNTSYLLQHAVKINKKHLRTRVLEDAGDENEAAQEEGGNDENADNAEEQGNEGENAEGEQDADQGNQDAAEEQENGEDENNGEQDENNEQNQDQEANNNEQEQDDVQEEGNDEGENGANEEEVEDNQENAEEEEEVEEEEKEEEEEDNEEEKENEDEQEADEADEEEEEVDDEDDDEEPQINFLKCAAFTVEPYVVDVNEMIQNGEVDEDEAAKIEKTYVTEMTSKLNTQESVIFFTYGNGRNDENQEIYMISIDDWITASYGYDQICHSIDQNDVEYVFSKIPSFSSVKQYSEHKWYAGFNCNADGSGVKTQLFLDDTCKTFSPTLNEYYPFKSATSENRATQDYSTQVSSDLTKYMIQSVNGAIEDSQYCDGSKFCENVFENSVEATTCGGDNQDRYRKLASYQIENDLASSIQDACPSIQTALGMDGDYEYSSYELEEMLSLWSNVEDGGQEPDRQQSSLASNYLWFYLAGLLLVGSITAYCLLGRKGKRKYDTDDSSLETKREPLVKRSRSGVRRSESDIVEDLSAIECTVTEKRRRRKSKSKKKSRESRSKSRSRRIREFRKKIGLSKDAEDP